MIIKCRTRERERGVTCLSSIKCKTRERGGHLPLGTMIIKCRTRERERERERGGGGGSLASRNNDYKV